MFLSYKFHGFDEFDTTIRQYRIKYKIIDSKFGEITGNIVVGAGISAAVIETYESRYLPVIPNLIRAIIWQSKRYKIPVEIIVAENKKYTSKFAKYANDIEKYIILI